ncbi:hypothetical protein C0993_012235 [Termitomyces sp. T159_Od127]|nr:hypothetical protein C0993_012235 [Termitomyces sp. T159_Od127]
MSFALKEMPKLSLGLIALALTISPVLAQQPLWAQCGGLNWTGDTTCVAGSVCTYQNDWYWQCIAASTAATPTTTSSSSSTLVPTSTHATSTTASATPTAVPSDFVSTSGTRFSVNGQPYTVVG